MEIPSRLEIEEVSQNIAEERFTGQSKPEASYRFVDPQTGKIWGFVVIDNTQRGPGLGGIRMVPDLSLQEVARLAYVMTFKNSAANLPLGGGKAGIVADPVYLNEHPSLKSELFLLLSESFFKIENYIPAPDMGTDEQDIQIIYDVFSNKLGTLEHRRGGAGRPSDKGGVPIDDWGLTAHGLFSAAKSLEKTLDNFKVSHCTAVVQGYGNVGAPIARKIFEAGGKITGASDINTALWNSNGLDVDRLDSARVKPGGLENYDGPLEKKWGPKRLDWLLEAPCCLLIPAARPDAINAKNADRLQCKAILQGANAPSNKMTEYYLQNRRKIISLSDFIVNSGGVIGCAIELECNANPEYRREIELQGRRAYLENRIFKTVGDNTDEIFKTLSNNSNKDILFREEAEHMASKRVETHETEIWI
jgi:glutamate dehydrogenase (NAD(P)+)